MGEKTKILFEREITPEDIITIVLWIKKEHELDKEKNHTLHFSGNGVFDSLVYGWSSELSHYALNFTEESLHESLAKPIGRDREYDLLVSSLSKKLIK